MIGCSMYILGVDTSTEFLSVGVCNETDTLAETTFSADRAHAERIIETIESVLAAARISLRDVDLMGVSRGPGSFTGVRIAVATMKGLALGTRRPLVGVSTLRALARAAGSDAPAVCPLLDARMNEVYGAIYRRTENDWIAETPDCVGPIEGIVALAPAGCVVLGDGVARYADRLRAAAPHLRALAPEAGRPSGAAVAREAHAAHCAGDPGDPAAVRPVYLRQSQPEEARRLRAQAASA